ncbi:hypothetical protein DK867_21325 [Ochrobactrum sp. POC9]|nr:hypothetical protein DK867_21325 [Ochrobactrum sp. POC9]
MAFPCCAEFGMCSRWSTWQLTASSQNPPKGQDRTQDVRWSEMLLLVLALNILLLSDHAMIQIKKSTLNANLK